MSSLSLFCQSSDSTSSLSCWDTRRGGTFQTRHAKTAVSKSGAGAAYAEVIAEASTDSGQAQFCKNKVQLFYAKDAKNYKVIYEKAGLDDQGVGIRLLGWSQDGTQLLMELLVWGYDVDRDVVKSALLLDSGTEQVKELPLADAFEHAFGKDCEFDSSVIGWQGNDRVLIRVGKTPPTTRYQQTFCVEKPTIYSFNLRDGKIQGGRP
ncbi:MAG TPA: hypothetical protein VG498_00105 [Terriglobales bacterium]|nr:hypothetical protein [Terriglobales bacterium]